MVKNLDYTKNGKNRTLLQDHVQKCKGVEGKTAVHSTQTINSFFVDPMGAPAPSRRDNVAKIRF